MSDISREQAERIILDHTRDIEFLSISEMLEDLELPEAEHDDLCKQVDEAISQATVTVSWRAPLPVYRYQPAMAERQPLYQHACGQVQPYEGSEYDGDVMECDGCALPDPWHQLFLLATTTGAADKDGAE